MLFANSRINLTITAAHQFYKSIGPTNHRPQIVCLSFWHLLPIHTENISSLSAPHDKVRAHLVSNIFFRRDRYLATSLP